jgi:hypothetical protein
MSNATAKISRRIIEAVRAYWNEAVKAAVGGINELP